MLSAAWEGDWTLSHKLKRRQSGWELIVKTSGLQTLKPSRRAMFLNVQVAAPLGRCDKEPQKW